MEQILPDNYFGLGAIVAKSLPVSYVFKDSRTSNNVARALLFVAKFSKKDALVRFSNSSVGIIWSGSSKTYFIHAEATATDMFKNRHQLQHISTVIQVNPSVLGKTLKSASQDRNVSICITKPNILKVNVEYKDTAKRTIVHTFPCEIKSLNDYKSLLIGEIEQNVCRYDTRSLVDNIHRFKHIVDSFVKLNTPRIYIWSKQSEQGNNLVVQARTQGSSVHVTLSDLEDGFSQFVNDGYNARRDEAGVNIDTKKLAFFLSSLVAQKKSKVSFDIEHNKCLKITLDSEIMQGEKFYQSLLLLHSLNN